jgi:hypothetical protein
LESEPSYDDQQEQAKACKDNTSPAIQFIGVPAAQDAHSISP